MIKKTYDYRKREDIIMKKKSVALLLCTMSVLFASCGKTTDAGSGVQDSTAVTEAGTETGTAETNGGNVTEAASATEITGEFEVTLEEKTDSVSADDGTEIFRDTYNYPKVSSHKNKEAADAIDHDIRELEKTHKTGIETMTGYAKDDYTYWKEGNTEAAADADTELAAIFPYASESTATVERNDAGIFSFCVYSYAFTGGAHGNYSYTGYNYDAGTGARLALTDLAEDADSFKQNILSDIEAQCATDAYKDLLFPEYADYLEDTVFGEDNWYLTDTGLVITCPPYAIGPYASGNIDFTISYDTLKTYGLKSSYVYQAD